MTIKCLNHQRSHEFICYQCNCLMCSKCITIHIKDHPDHSDKIEHIDEIKDSLSTLKLDDIIDFTTTNNSGSTNSMSAIENHFEQLHQHLLLDVLIVERDIINDKHTITNQIDKNIMNLKYLINIIILFNKLYNNNNSSGDNSSSGIINEDTSIIPDTTTLYSTTTIMESITTSSSLQSFINHNNQTLFNDYNNNYFNDDVLIQHHSYYSSSILVKSSIVQPFILVDIVASDASITTTTTTNNNDNKQSYIFITHQAKGATLINTSNNNSIEELKFDYQFDGTYSSIVSIGEYIYIFGGYNNENKWIKISIRSKSVEHIGDIEGIKGDSDISVCYDGQDHIYLVNGRNIKNRIDRFNIKTMKFESYHQLPFGYNNQASSMIFKGSLYSISCNQYKLFQFDLTNRTITDHQIDIIPLSSCHDNNGNFFILDVTNKRFIKYNVETKQTINLNADHLVNAQYPFVMYHRESPTSSYIYSFCNSLDSNFKYSIESNQCEPIFRDIKNHNSSWCASSSITF
ncbi:hypothetical protein PPL_04955 [Heterostelium album PN500]|uniref:B box-type domain-containing protein n=1 Tax=Heterostelium pallidum (strain ATCC 26659 / Pp 5 / PN500) TaxID=670386 RepID=D3B911_HETP5|nr:hypothetical protein PPL_04955 [Heterostelium album PN500]EFA82050.1 hypothetical protein PPL_04955 [Heterostelium album PN500]|eukprot:XP_020434167.1 hypothetical protein PPL_04955 [Heterostelium album PN500]